MFYYLSQYLLEWSAGTEWADRLSALRLFRYITFRSAGAAVTALVLSWWLGPRVIAWLKQLKFGQEYADKAEAGGGMAARLLSKKGTPTMGGILIVVSAEPDDAALGAMEHAGAIDPALGRGADRPGIL